MSGWDSTPASTQTAPINDKSSQRSLLEYGNFLSVSLYFSLFLSISLCFSLFISVYLCLSLFLSVSLSVLQDAITAIPMRVATTPITAPNAWHFGNLVDSFLLISLLFSFSFFISSEFAKVRGSTRLDIPPPTSALRVE